MGVSAQAIIGFGILCDLETVVPWNAAEFDGHLGNWWRSVNGFKDIIEPYTPDGQYAEGFSSGDPRLRQYYDHRNQWLEDNPLPIHVTDCIDDDMDYAIVLPESVFGCWDDKPKSFDPTSLVVTLEQVELLKEFLAKYEIKYEGEPQWFLITHFG